MTKKLKLHIAKFDKLLVVQQLEKEGEWEETEHVHINGNLFLFHTHIVLQENFEDRNFYFREFDDNASRDKYVKKLINWITEEQFGRVGDSTEKLKVGELCWVSNDGEKWEIRIYAGEITNQPGMNKRYLTRINGWENAFYSWKYAKPTNTCLEIDGEIYTWEIEE